MELVSETSPNNYTLNLGSSAKRADVANSSACNVNGDNRYVIATDCDDVLVNISDKWIMKATKHPELKHYFENAENVFEKFGSFLMRDQYYIFDAFGVKDPEHQKIFNSLYFDDPNFYDDLLPLPFMNTLKAMNDYTIGTIHVVTTSGETLPNLKIPANISKAKWLVRHFRDINPAITVQFHFLEFGKGKGAYMNEQGIVFNTFVDDFENNVIEVINSTPYTGYEIMIPAYGHNQDIASMKTRITAATKFTITPFHNFLHITQEDMIKLAAA
jgi:hypothetical protein